MKLDRQFIKIIATLEREFGWSDLNALSDNYRDLINDTIRATRKVNKNSIKTDVINSVCEHPEEALIRDKPTPYCLVCNNNIPINYHQLNKQ